MRKTARAGFSLLETVLAISVLTVVVGSLLVLGRLTVRTSAGASLRSQALAVAQAKIEEIRAARDQKWQEGQAFGGSLDSPPLSQGSEDLSQAADSARRLPAGLLEWQVEPLEAPGGGDQPPLRKVTVEVSWQDLGTPRNIILETYLSDWRVR